MSVRIALDNAPEFYTNLDFIQGRIILGLSRAEQVGNVVVKLEGESKTALSRPMDDQYPTKPLYMSSRADIVTENHKLLYETQQVYPNQSTPAYGSGVLGPGQHEFPFRFKLPLNNICGNPAAMAALSGIGGTRGSSEALFGGYRTMDGTKQLMLSHVRATLPPSLTGFPREAEIRYYIKVTIQRPGFFKENWRYQIGFKFLPVEPPRPPVTAQEAFARRPFAFKPQTQLQPVKKKTNPFSRSTVSLADGPEPPSIEMAARLPHPSILTCHQPMPLRLIAKKLAPSQGQVYMASLEIVLIGYTNVRVEYLHNTEVTRWVVCSANNLSIAIGTPTDPVDTEFVVPDALWANIPLPNTIAPSFVACNLSRRYEVEVKIGLSWGLPSASAKGGPPYPQLVHLPLKLSSVEVYTGITPPKGLLSAATQRPPQLPPRTSTTPTPAAAAAAQRPSDPLYPPQLGPQSSPHDDAPPSYDEAIAQNITAPADRPAYSGETAENAPSTVPEKN